MSTARFITEQAVLPSSGQRIWLTLDADTLTVHPEARDFALYLSSAGKAANTIRAYMPRVTRFLNWADAFGCDWKTVSLAQLARFKWNVEAEVISGTARTRSPKTVGQVITAVVEFLRYCARTGSIQPQVAQRLSEPRYLTHLPPGFDAGERGQFRTRRVLALRVREISKPPATLVADQDRLAIEHCRCARDRFQVGLLLDTGIRIGEALGLRRSDMHFLPDSEQLGCLVRGPHIHVVRRRDNANGAFAKSLYPRHVPVPTRTVDAYVEYQAERDQVPEAEGSDFVFVNLFAKPVGSPMTYSATKKVYERIEKSCGFTFRPHMLRHTAATRWLHEGGASTDTVSALLGHRHSASTAVYLHPSAAELRSAVERVAAAFHRGVE